MGKEIDLLINYPKTKRAIDERSAKKTDSDREIARKFGRDFFDGSRNHGYGGFNYSPKFWQPVIPTFQRHWNLNSKNSILDIGCAKGFMMHDFKKTIPGITIKGIDISDYAIENAIEEVRSDVQAGNANNLQFEDKSFDFAISINTVHNLERDDCAKALQEIERVSKKGAFITVDAYRNQEEKDRMYAWNLTAKTIMSVPDWVKFFDEVGYTGDYFWFIP
jgi:SAM-dependent methyltransferase